MASLWAALSGNTSLIATFSTINPFWLIHWLVTHVFVEILKWCLPGASVPRRHNLQTRLPPAYQKLHVWFQDRGRALLSILPVLASTDTTTPSAAHRSAYNKIAVTFKTKNIRSVKPLTHSRPISNVIIFHKSNVHCWKQDCLSVEGRPLACTYLVTLLWPQPWPHDFDTRT